MRLWFLGTKSLGFFFMGLRAPHWRLDEGVTVSKESRWQERRPSLRRDLWPKSSRSCLVMKWAVEGGCRGREAWNAGKKLPEGQPRSSCWGKNLLQGSWSMLSQHPCSLGTCPQVDWPEEGENNQLKMGEWFSEGDSCPVHRFTLDAVPGLFKSYRFSVAPF